MALRRTVLFLPGIRPDRFERALTSGADAVCVDLEDAVAPQDKERGRTLVLDVLQRERSRPVELIVRINGIESETGLRDLLAMCESNAAPDALMIPKLTSPAQVRLVDSVLRPRHPTIRLIAMIETVEGLEHALLIATASARLSGLVFGGVDLSTALRSARDWPSLAYARSRVVHAAATAEIDAIDMPYLDIEDGDGLESEARAAARLGFTGKTAIHPTQVPIIQQAFSPSPEEVARAKAIVAAYDRNEGGVLLVDGQLVERPVILSAQRTLAIAAATAKA